LNTQSPHAGATHAGHPLRVLLLSLEYTPKISGGVGTHVFELARGLSSAGCQVTVLAYAPGTAATLREPDLTVYLISPSTPGDTPALSMVQGILLFNSDLIACAQTVLGAPEQRPDLIHYHNWYTFPAAAALGRTFDIPIIGTIHLLAEPIERWWGQLPDAEIVEQEQAMFREGDRFITVSRSMRDLIQTTHRVHDDQIHVVYNALDLKPFMRPTTAPTAIRKLRATIAAPHDKIILFAGRLHPQKGIAALFASAAQVLAANSAVCYLLAGEPDSRSSSQMMPSLFQQHPGLRNKLKLLGKVPREQLALLYQIADIAIMPSIYEGFAYAGIEAMAAGVPVVATSVGGFAELIEHGRTGLLVPVHSDETGRHIVDIARLSAAQMLLLTDESLAQQLGKAGQAHVLNRFDLDAMIQPILQVYRQAITAY
jgi:alpha-maltose-1-phosphate synthase